MFQSSLNKGGLETSVSYADAKFYKPTDKITIEWPKTTFNVIVPAIATYTETTSKAYGIPTNIYPDGTYGIDLYSDTYVTWDIKRILYCYKSGYSFFFRNPSEVGRMYTTVEDFILHINDTVKRYGSLVVIEDDFLMLDRLCDDLLKHNPTIVSRRVKEEIDKDDIYKQQIDNGMVLSRTYDTTYNPYAYTDNNVKEKSLIELSNTPTSTNDKGVLEIYKEAPTFRLKSREHIYQDPIKRKFMDRYNSMEERLK